MSEKSDGSFFKSIGQKVVHVFKKPMGKQVVSSYSSGDVQKNLYGESTRPVEELTTYGLTEPTEYNYDSSSYRDDTNYGMSEDSSYQSKIVETEYGDGEVKMYTNESLIMKRPDFVFSDEFSLAEVVSKTSDIIEALNGKSIVSLDLRNLDEAERSIVTYVTLGACQALGIQMIEVYDYVIFNLVPKSMKVIQTEYQDSKPAEKDGLRYSNDY